MYMKKYLLAVVLFSVVLVWCAKMSLQDIDVAAIGDLTTLQVVVTQVTEELNAGTVALEDAQQLVDQLQQKYVDLTDNDEVALENQFEYLDTLLGTSFTLPLWAKKMGMTYPKGMQLDKALSTWNTSSTILVYRGTYDIALQQAAIIAKKAKLSISKDFAQAQALAKIGNVEYISWLDIGGLIKWVIYVNHELLDVSAKNFLSVGVDQNGVLTIETTKYN